MKPFWNFVNLTTRLPVDQALREGFGNRFTHHFEPAFSLRGETSEIDIFFVCPDDRDLRLKTCPVAPDGMKLPPQRGVSTDSLGVYLPASSHYKRPVILISPERIMDAAVNELIRLPDHAMSLAGLYETLLYAVIAHELAHAMMDECFSFSVDQRSRWQWVTRKCTNVEDVETELRQPEWNVISMTAKKGLYECWSGYAIEESLAEAFVLIQAFEPNEQRAVEAFIRHEAFPYCAGVCWPAADHVNGAALLLETMNSWRAFKRFHAQIMVDDKAAAVWNSAPADHLANRLALAVMGKQPGMSQIQLPIDFIDEFRQSLPAEFKVREAEIDEKFRKRAREFATPCRGAISGHDDMVQMLEELNVRYYVISADGTVDVNGDVDLSQQNLDELKVRFGTVSGLFNCGQNRLSSFKNFPKNIYGSTCVANNIITTLEGVSRNTSTSDGAPTWMGALCLRNNKVDSGGVELVLIPGLSKIIPPDCMPEQSDFSKPGPFDIISKYLGNSDDVFDCQAELVEHAYEAFASS